MTRLQAIRQIRTGSIETHIVGEQLLHDQPHRFNVDIFTHKKNGKLMAYFNTNGVSYGVVITAKQALHFLRRYYPRYG